MSFGMDKVKNTEKASVMALFHCAKDAKFPPSVLAQWQLEQRSYKAVTKVTAIHWGLPGIRKGKRNPTAFR